MKNLPDKNDFFISPLDDSAFAHTFGNKQNLDPTKAFLKALLDIPEDDYDSLTVESSNLKRYFQRDKLGIVDLMLTTKSGRIIHIEVQVKKTANLKNRALYYGTRIVSEQLRAGDDYKELHQVISIWICDHELFEGEEPYIRWFEMRDEEGRSLTDMLKLVTLELPKLPKDEDGALWPWLRFLKCRKEADFDMLLKKHPEVKEAVQSVKTYTWAEQRRIDKLRRDIARIDRITERNEAREEGKAEGRVEGLAEGKAEGLAEGQEKGQTEKSLVIARKMKSMGDSVERIHAITDLPLETIEKL